MTKLKCDVTSCASNAENCCCRPDIHVGGHSACDCRETCCDSFQEKAEAATNVVRHDFPDEVVDICCDACNCEYNDDGTCKADCVCVGGRQAHDKHQTECDTFCCR